MGPVQALHKKKVWDRLFSALQAGDTEVRARVLLCGAGLHVFTAPFCRVCVLCAQAMKVVLVDTGIIPRKRRKTKKEKQFGNAVKAVVELLIAIFRVPALLTAHKAVAVEWEVGNTRSTPLEHPTHKRTHLGALLALCLWSWTGRELCVARPRQGKQQEARAALLPAPPPPHLARIQHGRTPRRPGR